MKITSVETFAAPIVSRDVLIVKINTSEGISGIGEAYPVGPNRAVAAAIADRPNTGLVIGGDLNLVGSARPLEVLRAGLGSGGGDLAIVRPERLRDRSLATWRGTRDGDPFSPGRLDYVLYRSSVLRVERAFVLDAADLTREALERLRIRESDTLQSDHLPLVVDFAFRRYGSGGGETRLPVGSSGSRPGESMIVP